MSEEENCSVHGMNLFGFYVPEDEGGVSTAAVIATTTASVGAGGGEEELQDRKNGKPCML